MEFDIALPMKSPFIVNLNSPMAHLFGDNVTGIETEDAGRYVCVVDGEVEETVEIIVLGK